LRYGVIADIHANLPALRVALEALRREGVDSLLCLGDLVGYGPHPNEVVDAVAEREIPCVLGNHDEVVATGKGLERMNELASTTLEWTRERVTSDTRDYLAQLPVRREVDGGVLTAHGSIDDPWTYVRRSADALAQLDRMPEVGSANLLLVGHTHRQFVATSAGRAVATSEGILARGRRSVSLGERTLINPGAVGQSREWRALARFGVLDTDSRRVVLIAEAYPVADVIADLDRAGLPPHACHVRPSLKKVIRQAVRDREDRKKDGD
jgi:predicted phosphodiesterase